MCGARSSSRDDRSCSKPSSQRTAAAIGSGLSRAGRRCGGRRRRDRRGQQHRRRQHAVLRREQAGEERGDGRLRPGRLAEGRLEAQVLGGEAVEDRRPRRTAVGAEPVGPHGVAHHQHHVAPPRDAVPAEGVAGRLRRDGGLGGGRLGPPGVAAEGQQEQEGEAGPQQAAHRGRPEHGPHASARRRAAKARARGPRSAYSNRNSTRPSPRWRSPCRPWKTAMVPLSLKIAGSSSKSKPSLGRAKTRPVGSTSMLQRVIEA